MKEPIRTEAAPGAFGPYSQAIVSDGLIFCSGQVGVDVATGALVEGGVEAQAEQALINLGRVLEAAGASYVDVLKTTCFLADIGDLAAFNAVYERYFTDVRPARSTFAVGALPIGARIEIEAIAYAPQAV